jgi:uncharacterized protein (DUF58 family)
MAAAGVVDPELLAQVRRIQVRTNRLVTDVMAGGYLSVFRGAGIEFDEVREFAEGDDIRSVDWNVTARTGRPHVKKFMEERELTVLFLLDLSHSTRFGTVAGRTARSPVRTVRDVVAEFCACMALAAARNNDKAGLVAFSDRVETYVPAKKGASHVLRLIREALALEPTGRGTDLAVPCDYAAKVQRKRAVVFVVSDFLVGLNGAWPRALRLLARRHDVIAVRVADPATLALPPAGLVHLRDLETGVARWVDAGSRRVRAAHVAAMTAWESSWTDAMKRAGVDTMVLRSDRSIADPIVRFFRMRELRGGRR